MTSLEPQQTEPLTEHTKRTGPASSLTPNQTRLLLAITLVAFALRVWRLDWQPLWWDEGTSIYTTTLLLGDWIHGLPPDHTPLYYLLLYPWSLIGRDPFVIRFLSVLFGTLMVPLLAVVGRWLFGHRTGLIAALLLTFSPFALNHTQEARMYTLLPFLALLSWASLIRTVHFNTELAFRFSWHYPVAVALTAATHFYGMLLPLAHGAYLLTLPQRQRLLRPWLTSLPWAIVASLPWIALLLPVIPTGLEAKVETEKELPWAPVPFLLHYLRTELFGYLPVVQHPWLGPIDWGPELFGYALVEGISFHAVLLAIVGMFIVAGLVLAIRRRDLVYSARGLLASIALPLGVAYLGNFVVPVSVFPRLLSFSLGPLLLLVTIALLHLDAVIKRAGWIAIGLLFAITASLLYAYETTPRWQDLDYRPLAQRIAALSQPSDLVVHDLPWQTGFFAAYEPNSLPEGILLPTTDHEPTRLAPLANRLSTAGRIWLPNFTLVAGSEIVGAHALLAKYGYLSYDEHFGWTRLLRFGMQMGFMDAPFNRLDSPMGPDVRLLGFNIIAGTAGATQTTFRVNEVVPLVLFWQTRTPLDVSYTAFVHVANDSGQPVLFADDEPDKGRRLTTSWAPGETIADLHSIHLPANLAPGLYDIYIGMYDPVTGQRLPVEPHHLEGLFLTTISIRAHP